MQSFLAALKSPIWPNDAHVFEDLKHTSLLNGAASSALPLAACHHLVSDLSNKLITNIRRGVELIIGDIVDFFLAVLGVLFLAVLGVPFFGDFERSVIIRLWLLLALEQLEVLCSLRLHIALTSHRDRDRTSVRRSSTWRP